MKNSKSPIKFLGALTGMAGAAAGTAGMASIFGGGGGQYTGGGRAPGTEGLDMGGASSAGMGSQVVGTTPVTGVAGNFNPAAIQAANGIYGNVNARQSAVGGGGIYRNTSKYDNVD